MKKCPNCGKITDRKFCSECGTSLIDVPDLYNYEKEIEQVEDSAAKEVIKDQVVEEINVSKVNDTDAVNEQFGIGVQPEIKGETAALASFNKKKMIIAIAVIVALIIAIFAGVSISKANKAKAAQEEYDFAVTMMRAKAGMMLFKVSSIVGSDGVIDTCEELINLTNNVWHDAIYDEYDKDTSKYVSGASGFQEALENLYADSDIVAFTSTLNDPVDNLFMDQIPESLSDVKSSFVKLVTTYKDLASWCQWPNASYNTYMNQSQEKYDAFNNAYNEFDIICPQSNSGE